MPNHLRVWGKQMRARRALLGLSQAGLAARIGVSQGAVSQWELGLAEPETLMRVRIAAALDTDPEELFPYPLRVPRRTKTTKKKAAS